MTTLHSDSQLAPADWDMPGHLGAALNRLVELLSAWRAGHPTSGQLRPTATPCAGSLIDLETAPPAVALATPAP